MQAFTRFSIYVQCTQPLSLVFLSLYLSLPYYIYGIDGKHTVFGRVLDDASMLTVRKCEAVPVSGSTPRLPLTITQCGEL
jgi:cyclophilin family peptidyl-prolyl cis-trans isomerase